MKRRTLRILGAGGHGRVCADIARRMGLWRGIAFLDDDPVAGAGQGLQVQGPLRSASDRILDGDFFVAIGDNRTRERIQGELEAAGASLATLVHPSAVLADSAVLGPGTAVMAGAVVGCDARVGRGCILNTMASLDHDGVLGDFVHATPGVVLAGTVRIGRRVFLGAGSVVSNDVRIGDDVVVGAGGVVVRDLDEPGTYVGVPVRRLDSAQRRPS